MHPQPRQYRSQRTCRRQHAIDGGKPGVRGDSRQHERANAAAQRYGGLADAHGQPALAFAKPAHDGAAARSVHAAAQQADAEHAAHQPRKRRHVAMQRHHATCHHEQCHRGQPKPRQQHRAIAPAVGQQTPGQLADGDAEPQRAQRHAQLRIA